MDDSNFTSATALGQDLTEDTGSAHAETESEGVSGHGHGVVGARALCYFAVFSLTLNLLHVEIALLKFLIDAVRHPVLHP